MILHVIVVSTVWENNMKFKRDMTGHKTCRRYSGGGDDAGLEYKRG